MNTTATVTPDAERKAIQNRQAQKAFRERKKQHIKYLEKQVAELSHLCRVQTNKINRTTFAPCSTCSMNQKAVEESQERICRLEQAVANLTQQNTLLRNLVSGTSPSIASDLVDMPQQQMLMSSMIQPAGATSSRGRSRFHTLSDPASLYNNKVSSFDKIWDTGANMDASMQSLFGANTLNVSVATEPTSLTASMMDPFVTGRNANATDNSTNADTSIMGGAAKMQASPEMAFTNFSMPVKPYRTRFPSVGSSMAMNTFLPSPVSSTTSTPAIGFLDYATLMNSMRQQQPHSGQIKVSNLAGQRRQELDKLMGPKRGRATSSTDASQDAEPNSDEGEQSPMGREERKALQNRLAQKKFREKKEARIRELEQRVLVLSQQLGEDPVSTTAIDADTATNSLASEALDASISPPQVPLRNEGDPANSNSEHAATAPTLPHISSLRAQADTLEQRIHALMAENSGLRQTRSMALALMGSTAADPFSLGTASHNPHPVFSNLMMPPVNAGIPDMGYPHFVPPISASFSNGPLSVAHTNYHLAGYNSFSIPTYRTLPASQEPPTSSTARFGPPSFQQARAALKSLPSLTKSPWVDVLFDSLHTIANAIDARTLCIQMHALLHAKYRVFEEASMLDRIKAIELVELLKQLNLRHIDAMYEAVERYGGELVFQSEESGAREQEEEVDRLRESALQRFGPLRTQGFRDVIGLVPSLMGRQDLVGEFCDLFQAQAECTNRIQRARLFFKIAAAKHRVFSLCTNDDDRNRFALSLELCRQENREAVDDFFSDVDLALQKKR
ncbi:hypothetical protein BC830DRAFT_1081834 [Chytriomyces sp. MP71]|nr:hypothetical protein BC830DRAFT_1081834 [Chytriomyces sp. MP71]